MTRSLLFTPLKVGDVTLQHRVAMAPLTRFRASPTHVPSEIAVTYYAQRASVPGTLLITEATFISEEAAGYEDVPGIYTEEQIAAWKKITDAVHAKGSFIFLQQWALGRAADEQVLAKKGYKLTSSSDIHTEGKGNPTPLASDEIKKFVGYYAQSAKNAIKAGFDGVEVHGANGYLIDQFIQDVCNKRTDEYGGSIANRARFALEVVGAVCEAVGPTKTGIRLSPWSTFQDMRMEDPVPTFSYLINQLSERFPSLAYIHLTEPVVGGSYDLKPLTESESNDFARAIWQPKVYLTAGGYTAESALEEIGKKGDVVVFGRWFISNPDLPDRIKSGIPLNKYNRDTFYTHGTDKVEGYIDYPFVVQEQEMSKM